MSAREYRTAWWSYLLLGLALPLAFVFARWASTAEGREGLVGWGAGAAFVVLAAGTAWWIESKNFVRLRDGELSIKEGPETRTIALQDIVSAYAGTYFLVVKTRDGTETLNLNFQRPWELLAILRHVARQNALREVGAPDPAPDPEAQP